MSDEAFFKSTKVEADTQVIVRDRDEYESESSSGGGMRLKPLIESYRALINEQAIYYPVCYTFQGVLGEGRQGQVNVGLRQGARGCVTRHAIKVFDPGIYSSARKYWTDMGRIASQVSALHSLRSPNLVAMDAYDEVNGIGYVQMEVVNGLDLRQVINGTYHEQVKMVSSTEDWESFNSAIFREVSGRIAIQPGIAIYIMRMVLKGLEALHTAGFVHLDIKPDNIMVDRFGYIKLIDFGRAARPNEKATILLGSPLYMAPEVHRRNPTMEQSDIFSTALVGLELMTGYPAIELEDMEEEGLLGAKEELHRTFEARLPDDVRENQYLVKVMRRMLDPDPAKRHENVVAAESGREGLRTVHSQLAKAGQDADYARLMGTYMSKVVAAREALS